MKIHDIIRSLKRSKKLKIFCPHCDNEIAAAGAILFTEGELTEGAIKFKKAREDEILKLKMELADLKKKKIDQVMRGARSSNLGKILERYVPILPGFMHRPEESIPLLDPIDFIVFNGLMEGKIESLTFLDVKSGKGRLGPQQKSIKAAIENGKVSVDIIERGSAK